MHLIHLSSIAHLQMYKWNIAKRRCKSKVFVRAEEILETEEAKAGGKLSNSVCLFCSTKSETDWKLEVQNFILNPSKAVSWHWFSLSFVTLVLSQWPHGTTAPCMLGGFFKVCLGLLCYTYVGPKFKIQYGFLQWSTWPDYFTTLSLLRIKPLKGWSKLRFMPRKFIHFGELFCVFAQKTLFLS